MFYEVTTGFGMDGYIVVNCRVVEVKEDGERNCIAYWDTGGRISKRSMESFLSLENLKTARYVMSVSDRTLGGHNTYSRTLIPDAVQSMAYKYATPCPS